MKDRVFHTSALAWTFAEYRNSYPVQITGEATLGAVEFDIIVTVYRDHSMRVRHRTTVAGFGELHASGCRSVRRGKAARAFLQAFAQAGITLPPQQQEDS